MYKKVLLFILGILLFTQLASAEEYKYYIPGAYVNAEAEVLLNVLNPSDNAANIDVSIYYEKNDVGGFKMTVEPTRASVTDLSSKLEGNFGLVLSSDTPIAVDSVQYDGTYSGGFGTLAVMEPDYIWYFAEGYSSGLVKTYLYLLNPNNKEANVGVTLYYDNGQKKTFNVHVPAKKHMTVDLKEKTMPEKRFGMKVTSTVPVVASTGNYNKHFKAGSGGMGSTLTSKKWYIPEGYTSVEATDFLNLVNPSFGLSHYTVTLYYEDGTKRSFEDTLPAQSKTMIMLNNYAEENRWYSTVVESDVGIVAESTHYDSSYNAGHGGLGATAAYTDAYFAYGLASENVRSYLAVFNPSSKEAEITVTFFYSDGTTKELIEKAPSLMRSTVNLNSVALQKKPFGLSVASTEPVVVQQVVYDKTRSAGHSYIGLPVVEEKTGEEETSEEEVEVSEPVEEKGYSLVKQEVISGSRFKEKMQGGLSAVTKYTYDYDGTNLLVWKFLYDDSDGGNDALRAVLSGGLFELLEVTPDYVSGLSAHRFIAEKSAGYIWQNGEVIYIFVGEKGDADLAHGLAEIFVSGEPEPAKAKTGLGTILLVILGLILLILFIRWAFRRERHEDEMPSVWEEDIPSAKPKTKKQKKKSVKKEKLKKKKEPKKEKPAEKNEEPKKEKPAENKEEPHKKESAKPPEKIRNITIKEIPRDKLTAQDILDNLDEIPDYEDVFKHVNRDQEVIKPK